MFASFICLAGIACLSLSSDGFHFSFGDLLSLICAFFFACQIISLEFATKNCDSTVINTIQMSAAAIVSIPFALILEDFPTSIDTNVILSCLYMICIATWLAFQLQTLAQNIPMLLVQVCYYVQKAFLRIFLDISCCMKRKL